MTAVFELRLLVIISVAGIFLATPVVGSVVRISWFPLKSDIDASRL